MDLLGAFAAVGVTATLVSDSLMRLDLADGILELDMWQGSLALRVSE